MRLLSVFLAALFVVSGCECETVDPGSRGVVTQWGVVQPNVEPPGLHILPPGNSIHEISVRQQKSEVESSCFSSDLQEISVAITVLYSIPESSVISIFTEYHGEPFDVLIGPRVHESIKEATSSRSAEAIIKDREKVKIETLNSVRQKVGDKLTIDDIVIRDVNISAQLKAAIEAKMIQEQEANKAVYITQKAENDAKTARQVAAGEADAALIRARAEAESIKIRGDALRQNPGAIQLQLIEKWDGRSPQIVAGDSSGISILLPASAN